MLDKTPLGKILFLDIETTSQYPRFEDMPPRKKELFLHKFRNDLAHLKELDYAKVGEIIEDLYNKKAPLSPEFGKIICISVLRIADSTNFKYKTISFYGEKETDILESFIKKVSVVTQKQNPKSPEDFVCSHFGFLFDWPFMAKRMLYNGIKLPAMFDYAESKSWDVTWFIDTANIWKFTTYDGVCSLDLLCESFGIDSPKGDMSGDKVKNTYWVEKDLQKIATYCEGDVLALANCYLRMKGEKVNLTKQ